MSLINKTIWFSKPIQLNDPFDSQLRIDHKVPSRADFELLINDAFKEWSKETNQSFGVITPPSYFEGEILSNGFVKEISKFKQHIESNLRNSSILSLSELYNSTTMWSHYADSHKGICIEYETRKIFPKNNIEEIANKVIYKSSNEIYFNSFDIYAKCCANRNKDKYFQIISEINSTKTKDWSYEKEWRLINGNAGNSHHGEDAIKSIFFGLKSGIEEKMTIRNILHDYPLCFFQMVRTEDGLGVGAISMDINSRYWMESPE